MLPLLLATLGLAAEPVVTRGADSWVEGYVDVQASAAEVYDLLRDPARVAAIDGSTRVTTRPDGECMQVETAVEHPVASIAYATRSCPDGELALRQALVGGDMKEFESRWRVAPQPDGARLHYSIRTIPAVPVPQFLVDRASVKGTQRMLTRLRDHWATP